ncbi:MAG: tetratricopeptide repeat protein [Bacteroidales bacterium]|jgi:tetratricopeptide (TPR) repeat protein|nr:tetratricopeptide repeat protein [Bacteroidales bacterium]
MLKRIIVFCITVMCLYSNVLAQRSMKQYDRDALYKQALELYDKGQYAASRKCFVDVMKSTDDHRSFIYSNSQYYTALCAIELNQNDAESLLDRFIKDNPNNPKIPIANFRMARYHYNNKKYKKSVERFEIVSPRELDKNLTDEYYFLLGHSYFMEHDNIKARAAFFQIKDGDSKYAMPALYYYSHINYTDKNYETALQGFLILRKDETFGSIAPYYISQIYFLQEKYEQVIENAPDLLDDISEKRKDEVMHIVGESYYRLERYKEAIPYLEKYIVNKSPTAEDYYQLGYAYHQSDECDKAIKYFTKASNSPSSLGQNALCHLGDCYVKTGDKYKARLAFASAAQMKFSPEAQENAHFNFAALSYELMMSPFNEAIKSFNEFIIKYPYSDKVDEAYNYLVSAYTTTRNYRLALESIEKIRVRDENVNQAYQRVSFYRGLELLNDLKADDAISLFDKSLENARFDNLLEARCHYWKGETYYRQDRYAEAYDEYRKFIAMPAAAQTEEFKQVYYGLGYATFSLKKYPEALDWFTKYINAAGQENSKTLADAYNRLGDCYFMKPAYWVAIENYDKAINMGLSAPAYALFQKGFCYGLLDRHERKIETLTLLLDKYPSSSYTPDALYEMGRSFVTMNKSQLAVNSFNKLITDYPASSYVGKSLLQLGIVYYNMDKGQEALKYYKKVISDYPTSAEARNALIGIRTVYVDMNNVDAYVDYTRSLGNFANISLSEQDSLTYKAAENVYMTGDCQKSAASLTHYLDRFPYGSFKVNATFYLADCRLREGKTDEAMKGFEFVISQPRNMFTEQALMSASAIYFNGNKFEEALKSYQRMETEAEMPGNILDAKIGVMRSLFRLNRYQKAIEAADKVLNDKDLPEENIREATFILARSYQEEKNFDRSMEEYRKVAKEVSSREGAESKYHIIEILVNEGKLKDAEDEIFDFVAQNTPHQYFMAKSFILLSDIYAAWEDDFQAIHTLQSVIDNYDSKDDGIIELAQSKKIALEAKVNATKEIKPEDIEVEIK